MPLNLSFSGKPDGSFFSLDEKNMGKICYRLIYNREKHFNLEGKALVQIEAYQNGKRIYFPHIFICLRNSGMTRRN